MVECGEGVDVEELYGNFFLKLEFLMECSLSN